jgi:hypothetical protein
MSVTQLLATTSAEEHWHAVAGPWLREQAVTAWKEVLPTVVLTPGRAEGFHLRSRLVEEGTPLLGVRFWTPSDARQFLLAQYPIKVRTATQSDLRLLTRTCAERLVQRDGAENASLRSVIREPAAFLRAYDLLLGAGWNPAQDGADYGRELALELQREMDKSGIATQAGLHRQLFGEASRTPRAAIANLLVSGFNAAHWPLWDLLKALVRSSEQAVVALSQPRYFGETIDQLWINSWEDFTKQETAIPDTAVESPQALLAPLAASYETGARETFPDLDLTFCVTPDLATQTRAIVLHALDYLQRDECTRLGLVFPEANALALGVADELRRLGIPMNDGPGVLTPGPFECRAWPAWLALQEEPGVPRLIAWLRACEAEDRSTGAEPGLGAETIASVVEGALGETLVDDLAFLARHLESNRDKHNARAVAEFLQHRVALPKEETFARFLELTREALALRGWEFLLAALEAEPPEWLRKSKAMLSRRVFLDWLRESNDSQTRVRGKESNHFYGRVHLLVYGQLGGQTWSHLILTGMNEGVWPRVFEAGAFGSRHELAALNQQARALNRRVRGEGTQGEGQEVVREGFGHCLLPLERQDLALRDLCAALESTSHAVCLAAVTTEAGRGLLPSDFFNHSYHVATGHTLSEESFRRLANATAAWCREHAVLLKTNGELPTVPIEYTRAAHAARRDATQPFGAYEFAYDTPPERPIQLWCKEWESAWNHPATVWLESVIGASQWPEGTLSWPRAIGTWAHDWLAQALRENGESQAATLIPLVETAAERTQRRVRERASSAGLELYPWWEQVWAHARAVAVGLAENLQPVVPGRRFEAEYRLRRNIAAALPGSPLADFELKGRIDLLLFPPGEGSVDPTAESFSGTPCWVVDFKTGSAKALKASDVAKGGGLQSLLYAMAMRSLGAGATNFSLLTRNAELKEQVDLDTALQNDALFRSLEIMHRAGIFGMRPDAESEYGFSPEYPLATRFIARHILEAKWARVHGGLPGEEEEDA